MAEFRQIRCRGCGRRRSVPWPASEVARICPECTRLTRAIEAGDKRAAESAAEHVTTSRMFRGLRARLSKAIRRITGREKLTWPPR